MPRCPAWLNTHDSTATAQQWVLYIQITKHPLVLLHTHLVLSQLLPAVGSGSQTLSCTNMPPSSVACSQGSGTVLQPVAGL